MSPAININGASMDTLYRQWLILRMIPRRSRIATLTILGRLSSEYGIETTLRTIQRDLNALEENRFPLECDNNRPAGWSWRKDAPNFDLPNMDPVTALTFKLAEKYLTRILPQGTLSALQPYIRSADERLKSSESSLARWPEKIRVVSRNLAMIPPVVPEEISAAVSIAVLEERRFTASYRTVTGSLKRYEVNPLGLVFVDGMTYLVASLNQHETPALLLLHRIQSLKMLEVPATALSRFNLDDYVATEFSFAVGEEIQLKVVFSRQTDMQRLKEAPLATDQSIVIREDGRFEVTATVTDSRQLRWWLRGFGDRVEVLAPEFLRADFKALAEKMGELYRD